MADTTIPNTPPKVELISGTSVSIDLVEQGKSTGWSTDGSIATHVSCNFGCIKLKDFVLTNGVSYTITLNVISITGGYLNISLGSTVSPDITTTGFKTITLTSAGDNILKVCSDANTTIELIAIKNNTVDTNAKQKNTLAYAQTLGKWTSFYNFTPDNGCSLFTNLYTYRNGLTYLHDPLDTDRAEIYGTQYYPYIKAVFNQAPTVQKVFQSINMNSGTLMVTETNGVQTSLGQLSDLKDKDFLQHTLSDGVTTINVYNKDGIYLARFVRDSLSSGGLNFGNILKGNYITVDLYAPDPDTLQLMSVSVKSVPSIINVR